MSPLEIITYYGLSIRQIPNIVYSTFSYSNHKEGNDIVYSDIDMKVYNYDKMKEKLSDRVDYVFNDELRTVQRLFTRESKIPNNAGYWMCKQIGNTNSSVQWNINKDNLASTLEESLQLFLASL